MIAALCPSKTCRLNLENCAQFGAFVCPNMLSQSDCFVCLSSSPHNAREIQAFLSPFLCLGGGDKFCHFSWRVCEQSSRWHPTNFCFRMVEVQLSDVTDADRFQIIDLYRQSPSLWSRDVGAGRDKALSAWNFIAENVSTSGRVFPGKYLCKIKSF